jgi:hypothetical protein
MGDDLVGPTLRMAFSTKLFSLDVPDEWHDNVVLTFVNPYGSASGHTVNIVSQAFSGDPTAVQDYADEQVHHLQHDLRGCQIINRLVYNYGDKPVPISEYSWRNGESDVFQCQAYLHSGDRIWTFTFTSNEAGYAAVRANIPDLISRFSPAGERT